MTSLAFRIATAADLSDVAALEREAFDSPWSSAIYEVELPRPESVVELAIDAQGCVVGLSCCWMVADECHLLRVGTNPGSRRQGVGTVLLSRVIERARAAACISVLLEVAASNAAALELYTRAGFVEVGRRNRYYRRPIDDAILMTLDLGR